MQTKWFLEDKFATHFPHLVLLGTLVASNREELIQELRKQDIKVINYVTIMLIFINSMVVNR